MQAFFPTHIWLVRSLGVHPPPRLGLSPGFRLDPVELLLLLLLPQSQGFLCFQLGRGFRLFVAVPVLVLHAIWVHVHLLPQSLAGTNARSSARGCRQSALDARGRGGRT